MAIFGLLALFTLSGCAGLRSQPRFRPPAEGAPGGAPGRQEKPGQGKRDREAERERAKAEKEARKARRKDARKGGGLPSFRIFPRTSSDLVEGAERYLGVHYRYGGNSRRGMDCSGLVWRTIKDVWGHDAPRSSVELSRLGMPVSRRELQGGDLVFFHTGSRKRISHVGIYKGGGQFVHSSTSKGVEVASMDEGYWRRRMICARRLTKDSLPQ